MLKNQSRIVCVFHSDGYITLCWMTYDLGIDGLHPLEPAARVDIGWVKKQLGTKFASWVTLIHGDITLRYPRM